MENKLVLDTSIFMENLDVIDDYEKVYDIYFPAIIADELNHLKDSNDSSKSYKARKAIRYINSHSKDWFFDSDFVLTDDNDYSIIDFAIKNECKLATFDFGIMLRAQARDLELVEVKENIDLYTGFKTINLYTVNDYDMSVLARYYEDKTINHFNCLTNEYIIIKQDGKVIDRARWDGYKYKPLINPPDCIKAKNDEQLLAIDLLLDKDIPVKVIFGNAGSGKTFLSIKLGLEMLRDCNSTYDKLMLIRNPLGSGEKIGYLKGDKEEKIIDFYKPFQQHFDGDYQEFQRMQYSNKLDIEIPYYMKGLDIRNSLVIFDEAEDSDEKIMRLVGTRLAEGSSIIILGDSKQAENQFNNRNNGLIKLLERAKGSKIFGCVYLQDDLRSEASKLFAELF